MKKNILLLFLILKLVSSHAQSWEWAQKTGELSDWAAFKMTPSGNNGFYLTGRYIDSITIHGFSLRHVGNGYFLGKFDDNGNCQWLKESFSNASSSSDVAGNLYLHGYFHGQIIIDGDTIDSSYPIASILAKYAPSGSLLNLEKLDGAWGRIKTNSQNQLIVAAGSADSTSYQGSIFNDSTGLILKLDSNLNLLQFVKTCTFSSVEQIEIDNNDTIYLVANKDNPCLYCGVTKLLKFTPSLTIEKETVYSAGVGSHYYSEPIVTSHENLLYFIQPVAYSSCSGMKYKTDFNRIWGKPLDIEGWLISKNNKLFMFGDTHQKICGDSVGMASMIVELDTALNCLWNKTLPLDNVLTGPGPFFENAFIDDQNNIYVCGTTNRQTFFDTIEISHGSGIYTGFIAKLKYPMIPYAIAEYKKENELSAYPNPSSGIFDIKIIGENMNDQIQLNIKNMMGQIIYSNKYKVLNGKVENRITLPEISKGIYIIEAVNENLKQTTKLLIN